MRIQFNLNSLSSVCFVLLRSVSADRRFVFPTAETTGENAVGVVLSGMFYNGAAGLRAIIQSGGYCIVQDPLDAAFGFMPIRALDKVDADFVGTAGKIAGRLVKID